MGAGFGEAQQPGRVGLGLGHKPAVQQPEDLAARPSGPEFDQGRRAYSDRKSVV